ncbi:internal scaffolding protein [Microviridae sp.]|nr:internal scaffolding protein [Microviridae sp.]
MEIRKAYDRVRTPTEIKGESRTHQAHKDECDINRIMQKWAKTGVVEHRNTFQGQYADFTNTPGDYQEAMNQILEANAMFMSLPSGVRRRFGNDAGSFLDFATDPENAAELQKMGLTKPPATPTAELIEKPSDGPKKAVPDKGEKPKGEPKPKAED